MPKRTGPAPRPELKLLPGTAGMRRTPTPAERPPEPPHWLTTEQRRIWARVTSELDSARILARRMDEDIICAYTVAVSAMRDAAEVLARDGVLTRGANGGTCRHPAIVVFTQQARLVDSLAGSLGLSPDARARLRMPIANNEASHSTMDDLFA